MSQTPITGWIRAAASSTVTNYSYANCDGGGTWSATLGARSNVTSVAGVMTTFTVSRITAPGAGTSVTYTLYVSGVATAATVTISDTALKATITGLSVAVADNDTLTIESVPTNTPAGGTDMYWNVMLDSTTAGEVPLMSSVAANLSTSATEFLAINGSNSTAILASTDLGASGICAAYCSISSFRMIITVTPQAGRTRTFELMKSGVATGLSVTFNNGDLNKVASGTTVNFVPGDTWSLRSTSTGTPVAAAPTFSLTALMTTVGETPLTMGNALAMTTTTTAQFQAPQGGIGLSWSSETVRRSMYPAGVVRNLYVALDTAPGGATTRTFTLRDDGASTAVTCVITGAATTGSDTTNSATIVADSLLCWQMVAAATPAATGGKVGGVFYIAPPASTGTSKNLLLLKVG